MLLHPATKVIASAAEPWLRLSLLASRNATKLQYQTCNALACGPARPLTNQARSAAKAGPWLPRLRVKRPGGDPSV